MPQGTVTDHKGGAVALRVPYDATVSDYKFYSSEDAAGPPERMVLRQNVAAPAEAPPGFQSFELSDAALGIRKPDRGAFLRITKVVAGLESSKFAEPMTSVPGASDGGKTIRASIAAGNLGPVFKAGLFDFGQQSRITVRRITAAFGTATPFVLSIVNGSVSTKLRESVAAVLGLSVDVPVLLEKGEYLVLTTTTGGAHEAEVTRE
jgi:hypothetical protein